MHTPSSQRADLKAENPPSKVGHSTSDVHLRPEKRNSLGTKKRPILMTNFAKVSKVVLSHKHLSSTSHCLELRKQATNLPGSTSDK